MKKEKERVVVNGKNSSTDEIAFATLLDKHKVAYRHNEERFIVDKGFDGFLKHYRDCTYTPDFIIVSGNRTIVVEIKGFKRGDNDLRLRLADKHFSSLGWEFYVLKYKGKIKDGTKGFYDYSNANFDRLKNPREHEFFTKVLHITE